MANKKKSVIEEALLEAEQIDSTFKANAKEILTQTMGSEIEEMVKESLGGSPKAINEDEDDDMEATDLEMGDDMGADDLELDLDLGDDDELEGDEMDMDMDMDVIDLTGLDNDDELIKVFKSMDPDSEIEVVQDEDGVSFTDNETGAEYKVELGGYLGGDMEGDMDMDMGMDIEMEDDMDMDNDEEVIDMDMDIEDDMDMDMEDEEEVVYEIEITEDDEEDAEEGGDKMDEAPRTMSKLKGRKYGNPKRRVESRRPNNGSTKVVKENKVLKNKLNDLKSENVELKENHEKMVDALKQFRQKLQEVAVFNSNLAHVVRLFTENTTTKEEKVDIVKRMDEAKTIKESKMIFKTVSKELVNSKPTKSIQESVNDKINKTASTGSKGVITESKVFENPELANQKRLWEFNYKY
tara:strand:+ start:168 stop:1394 length:1227 start_codon:yes stop_codon:yes gene_type:complete